MTSACGIVLHGVKGQQDLTWQKMDITRAQRANQKTQKARTIWFTGLSGAGKSALANELEKRLFIEGKHTMSLDGDNIRLGLNQNLSFAEEDRIENIRRIAEVSKLMNDAGLIVLCSFVSPYERDRENARVIIGEENFIEVYVSTSLEECEKRDVKGLYKKAREGKIQNFTGITSPYEVPLNPNITIDTGDVTVEQACDTLLSLVEKYLS
jgi:bifunctional enzyme CysN/CysC